MKGVIPTMGTYGVGFKFTVQRQVSAIDGHPVTLAGCIACDPTVSCFNFIPQLFLNVFIHSVISSDGKLRSYI